MSTTISITEVSPFQYKNFSCGIPELDEYLKRYAKPNHKKGIGKTFVLLSKELVIGYYTISMGNVEFHRIPEICRISIPKYPIPVGRIGKLAIDNSNQGKGFGKYLLIDALNRITEASRQIAAYAVVVDAKNIAAKAFYEHYGFIPYQDEPMSLFIPIASFQSLL